MGFEYSEWAQNSTKLIFYKKIPEPVKKDITGPIFQHNQKLKGLNNSKSVQLNIDVCPLKNYKVKFTKKTEF